MNSTYRQIRLVPRAMRGMPMLNHSRTLATNSTSTMESTNFCNFRMTESIKLRKTAPRNNINNHKSILSRDKGVSNDKLMKPWLIRTTLIDQFKEAINKQKLDRVWSLYCLIVEESKTWPPLSPLEKGTIPYDKLNSSLAYINNLHPYMLGLLNFKGMYGYGPREIEIMSNRIKVVLGEITSSSWEITSVDLTNLLNFFAATKNEQASDQIWQYAVLNCIPRDITNYNAYINSNIETNNFDRAFEVLREIKAVGLQPTSYTIECLIRLHGLSGDLVSAERTFQLAIAQKPKSSGSGPVKHTLKERFANLTHGVLNYWKNTDINIHTCSPTVYMYNTILEIYGLNGLVDKMRELMDSMMHVSGSDGATMRLSAEEMNEIKKHQGIKPTRASFHSLIKWHAKYWDMDSALKYMQAMENYGIKPNAATFKILITKETALRNLNKCAELALLMVEHYRIPALPSIVRILESTSQKINNMEDMIKQSEAQKSIFSPTVSLEEFNMTQEHDGTINEGAR